MIKVEMEKNGIRVIRDGVVRDVVEEIAYAVATEAIDAYTDCGNSPQIAQVVFMDILLRTASMVKAETGADVMNESTIPLALKILSEMQDEEPEEGVEGFGKVFAEKMADDGMEDNLPWLF